MDYPNCPGGGKRGAPPCRESAKSADGEDEDEAESRSSESPNNCFGFVAYSVNSGEKSRVKIKAVSHPPPFASSARCDPDRSLTPSPSPSPSPRKLRCMDQREPESLERRERDSKRRRAREGNPNDPIDLLWLG